MVGGLRSVVLPTKWRLAFAAGLLPPSIRFGQSSADTPSTAAATELPPPPDLPQDVIEEDPVVAGRSSPQQNTA